MRKFIIMVAATASVLGGCATIQGTTQDVKVDSTPQGATVSVGARSAKTNGAIVRKKVVGTTPMVVKVSRKDGVIVLDKPGYQTTEVPLVKKGVNPWFWGDVVLLSLVSTSVDTSTGAIDKYDPKEYVVPLRPAVAAPAPAR